MCWVVVGSFSFEKTKDKAKEYSKIKDIYILRPTGQISSPHLNTYIIDTVAFLKRDEIRSLGLKPNG